MGLIFKLFEVTSYNDVEIKKEHTLEEVASFSNGTGMLITEWFYRINGDNLKNTFDESSHYVTVTGDLVYDIVKALDLVLCEDDGVLRNLLALHYFPPTYQVGGYVSSVDMFSDEYYDCLSELYSVLKGLLPTDVFSNKERLFVYNVKW